MKIFTLVKSTVLLLALVSFVSCGSQSGGMLKNVQVETELVDSEVFVTINSELGIGNLIMPNIAIPILQPGTQSLVGEVGMYTSVDGQNELRIDLNLSALTNYRSAQGELPNGNVLPLIGSNSVLVVPLSSKANLYLSLDNGNIVVGVAVGISSFDKIGAKLGSTSLFPLFTQGGKISAAGIYTSREAGKNGFGFFTDLSGDLSPEMLSTLFDIQMQQDTAALELKSIKPSSRVEKKLNYELYKMHKRRVQLKVAN